jgi:hypothetical protein
LFRRSVLTHRFQSESEASELDLVIQRIDMAIMAIQVTGTDTTDHIGTMAILGDADTTGTTGIEFTATTVIIITIATNLA